MAQARPAKNERESWWVVNKTSRELSISDISNMPTIRPGQRLDLLRFATREQISYSSVLPRLIKSGRLEAYKVYDPTGEREDIDNATSSSAFIPRQQADNEHVENAEEGGSSELGGLEDVDLTGLDDAQVLQYNLGSDTWVPVDLSVLGGYGTSDFNTDFATKSTSDLAEGTRLYFTDARARAALSAASPVLFDSGTGVFSFDGSGFAAASHTHTVSQITDFPAFATVATSGNYSDLNGIPSTFTPSAHTHTVSEITDFPTFSTVAFTGDYDELVNVPSTFAPSAHTHIIDNIIGLQAALNGKSDTGHTHTVSEITDFPSLATVATTGAYGDLSGTPDVNALADARIALASINDLSDVDTTGAVDDKILVFTSGTWIVGDAPAGGGSSTLADLTDTTISAPQENDFLAYIGGDWINTPFDERVDDRVAALLVEGTNIDIDYNDGAGTITITATGSAGGGPTNLEELGDVDLIGQNAPQDGYVLTYQAGSADLWVAASKSRNPDVIDYNLDSTVNYIDFDDGARVNFSYDGNGNLQTITEGSAVKTLQYDGEGRISGIVLS